MSSYGSYYIQVIYKIDFFCNVIDNYGDIGVVWRLIKTLDRSLFSIRLIINDLATLKLLVPETKADLSFQFLRGIEVFLWNQNFFQNLKNISETDVAVEAFACQVPEDYYKSFSSERKNKLIVNLDYLTAESWAEEIHGMNSFVNLANVRKRFFVPGFKSGTGGLILDQDFLQSQKKAGQNPHLFAEKFLSPFGIRPKAEELILSLFSYEHNFVNLFSELRKRNSLVLVTSSRHAESVRKTLITLDSDPSPENPKDFWILDKCRILFLPFLNQKDYDCLLLCCGLNFVRGEESFVRACLSGIPFVWQAYLQKDRIHLKKVEAFLDFFSGFFTDISVFGILKDLFLSYNNRIENSWEIHPKDSGYNFFLDNLPIIKKSCMKMSLELRKLNQADIFKNFILESLRPEFGGSASR